jgi:hypothetical protein
MVNTFRTILAKQRQLWSLHLQAAQTDARDRHPKFNRQLELVGEAPTCSTVQFSFMKRLLVVFHSSIYSLNIRTVRYTPVRVLAIRIRSLHHIL